MRDTHIVDPLSQMPKGRSRANRATFMYGKREREGRRKEGTAVSGYAEIPM